MGFEQDTSDAAEAHEVEQHKLTHLLFGDIAHVPRLKKAHTMSRVLAACRSSAQTTWVRMERRSPLQLVHDGLTEAFFVNVVLCEGKSHGYAEKAVAQNVLSTGHQIVILQSDPEPSTIDVKHDASTHIPTEIVHEESPVAESNAKGSIPRAKRSIKGQILAIGLHRTTGPCDKLVSRAQSKNAL